ncbi:hypothetical protein EYF80_036455 [Liparis tanakae]|uniref:Uncharacterized protein n=1 Tax=Liparis tanakae TaxID=230148 RepID=A0A4Z2GJ38_9TELE|nr:hypothetical protein EYF80_036455 [Liparis tanakae]
MKKQPPTRRLFLESSITSSFWSRIGLDRIAEEEEEEEEEVVFLINFLGFRNKSGVRLPTCKLPKDGRLLAPTSTPRTH